MTPILQAQQIVKRFGAFTALDKVDFDVVPGEIHALLGENGAGKSTLMNILSGLLRPTEGEIRVSDTPVRFASPSDAERQGIGMVHQHFLLVPPLSVRENLLLGASSELGGPLSYPVARAEAEARALADTLGWKIPWDAPAGSLPVGTQQRVEILKALRGVTRVLIFDEPTAVLTPTETPELFETIRRLAAEGAGIVFISHKLKEVLELAGRVTVLRRGRVVAKLNSAETDAAGLAEAMVGRDSDAAEMLARGSSRQQSASSVISVKEESSVTTDPRAPLSVQSLTLHSAPGAPRPALSGISFTVAPGEILGIAGVDGNGQAELAECLAGLTRPQEGEIRIDGQIPPQNAAGFRHVGVAVIVLRTM
jgi:simple sugar transport system ATP-binding protein